MHLATITNPAVNAALGRPGNSGTLYGRLEDLISLVIGLLTVAGSIYFIFQIFTGALQWISAGSDKDAVSRAQRKFTNAIVGLVLLLFAYTLIAFVARILGYNIFDVAGTLSRIMP